MNDTVAVTDGPAGSTAPAALSDAAPSPELTLDLRLAPDAVSRFWRARALAALRNGRLRAQAVTIVWHDAPDGGLGEAGLALLHVREGGRSSWQRQHTVRDGVLVWPLGVPAPPPDDGPAPEDGRDPPDGSAWPQIAVAEGQRRLLKPHPGTRVAEVGLLEGVLTVAAVSRPLALVSLRGDPTAVFALARALLDELPLIVPNLSLSQEMRQVLRGGSPPPPPVLDEALKVDDAFAHVVGQLTATIAHHAPAAGQGRSPEPVHQMRVALRRLRSALSLFRRVASSPELEAARRDTANLARALGPARDWDVFLAGTGRDVTAAVSNEPALKRLMAAARRRRRGAYAALARLLASAEYQRMLLDLIELAVLRRWERQMETDPVQERPLLAAFARHALDRKLRRVSEAADDLDGLSPPELHAVRIRCKRLRYAAEFFAPLAPRKPARRFLRRLAAVQERLGRLNDGAVAAELLDQLGPRRFAAGIVRGYLAARASGGRAKAARSWRKFRRTEPFWN